MKNIALLLLTVFIIGCKNFDLSQKHVIVRVHRVGEALCQYDVSGNSSPEDIDERTRESISFTEMCYKFQIGDTVSFIPVK